MISSQFPILYRALSLRSFISANSSSEMLFEEFLITKSTASMTP